MTDVLKMSRKALTLGVVLATILWSVMASVLVAPLKASAAGCTSGSLIKGSLSAVYYCGADMKRYVFTNDKAYFTWYSNFSGVMTISDADLAGIQIGGNVTYRPGVKMIKIQSDPKVYAIGKMGVLRAIGSEAVAACLYGSTWNKQIDDISDAFFTNYSVGNAINSCSDYDKTAEMSASQTVNQDKNLSSGPSTLSGLTVSLASDTPASATVPLGATGVNFLKFNVTNGTGSSMTVDSMVLHRIGAGSPSDFSNVYLYEGSTRLTTGRSVNSSTNDVTFNSLGLSFAAGQTRTLWVSATMASNASSGDVNAFQVTSLTSGTAQASGLPVTGNNMTMAGTLVGSITVAKTGSITNPKVGQKAAKVAEFTLAAGAVEDLDVKGLTLFNSGSISRSNLTNFKLVVGGQEVAAAAGIDDKDHITFVLTQASLLERGNTRTFQVVADVSAAARVSDSIKLYVEEDLDVKAVGRTFGYGVRVTRTAYDGDSCTSTSGECSYSTVEGGQITVSFNGPATHDLATNGKDMEVFNFTIASQANVEIRNLRLAITAGSTGATDGLYNSSAGVANYTDIKVVDTASNVTVAGPKDVVSTPDDTQPLVYTDVITLSAGQSRTFKVTLDVANQSSLDGDTVRVDLAAFQSSDIRNLDNSTFIATTDIVPSSAVTGNANTVRTPSLIVSTASTPVSQTFIKGSQNINLAGISLKAGDAGDVKVTAITVTSRVESATSTNTPSQGCDFVGTSAAATLAAGLEIKYVTDILLSAKLMNGTTQVGDAKSPTSAPSNCTAFTGGALQFTNLNLTIPHGQTITLSLVGNLSSSISNLADYVDFTVTGSSDVTAQDPDGNSITPSGTVDSNSMTIADTGSMTYALASDDSESEAGLVVGGTTAVLAKYRFTAANEELKLTKVRMQLPIGSATAVTSMYLFDGATQVAGPVSPDSSGAADFSSFAFIVPKDGNKTLTVKGLLNSVGSGGAQSGLDLMVTMCDGVDSDCGGSGASEASTYEVRGTSAGSSTLDTVGDSNDVNARTKIIRRTKLTVATTSMPSNLESTTKVLSRFTITADVAQQVSVKAITWQVVLNNAGGAGLSITLPGLREVGGSDLSASSTTDVQNCTTGTGSLSVTCTIKLIVPTEIQINAGGNKMYEMYGTIVGAETAGESVSSKLLGDTTLVTGELASDGSAVQNTFPGYVAKAAYNFIWSDNSALAHNDTSEAITEGAGIDNASASNDWTNSKYVKLLPATDSQTLFR